MEMSDGGEQGRLAEPSVTLSNHRMPICGRRPENSRNRRFGDVPEEPQIDE